MNKWTNNKSNASSPHTHTHAHFTTLIIHFEVISFTLKFTSTSSGNISAGSEIIHFGRVRNQNSLFPVVDYKGEVTSQRVVLWFYGWVSPNLRTCFPKSPWFIGFELLR